MSTEKREKANFKKMNFHRRLKISTRRMKRQASKREEREVERKIDNLKYSHRGLFAHFFYSS